MATIDVHTHFFPRHGPDFGDPAIAAAWPSLREDGPDRATIMLGGREFRPITSACWDAKARLADMDRAGVEIQIVSATPVMFGYDRPAAEAVEAARVYNDAALALCAQGGGRLKSLCQVPLQDIELACTELTRAMRGGHVGVQIGTHVGGRNLDDADLLAFLAYCASAGAPVFVHPWDMLGADRTARYMAGWTVGMPAETQLAIVSLILGGGFDRLPSSLRICFAHGGGSFAFLLGRLENAWRRRDIARGVSRHPPAEYLDRFFVDSAVFDRRSLRLLLEVIGEHRIMLGSDYPFPLGEASIGSLVGASGISDAARRRILGANAARFLGLAAAEPIDAVP